MRKLLLSVLVVVFALNSTIATAEPRSKKVKLHSRTELIAYIVPDLGIRFTFPFVLDEQDTYIPFTLKLTNPAFKNERQPGRNYFVITSPPTDRQGAIYGNLFMNVAGFEISVELRTTNDLSKFYSDIVFDLTDEDRENLIQKGVAQRTKALESEYKKKFEELDSQAEQRAIAKVGKLALTKPEKQGVKEETHLTLSNGDKVHLFVDQRINYSPYAIFVFNVIDDSNTQGLSILDAKIFSINKETKQVRPLDVGKDIPPRVQPNETIQGAVTLLESSLNPKEFLKLQVLTDKGILEAQW